MSANSPKDARLTIQGVRGVQTLSQYVVPGKGGAAKRVSTVSAVVAAQIEFTDPVAGVQRRRGTAEYTLEITQRMRR